MLLWRSSIAICWCANVAHSLTSKQSSVGGVLWSSSTHVRLICIKLSSEARCIIESTSSSSARTASDVEGVRLIDGTKKASRLYTGFDQLCLPSCQQECKDIIVAQIMRVDLSMVAAVLWGERHANASRGTYSSTSSQHLCRCVLVT